MSLKPREEIGEEGALMPGGDWKKTIFTVPVGNGMNFAVGDFVGVIINFLIVACVVFFPARYANKIGLR